MVVLFGICEFFGIIGADEHEVLQWIHLILLMITMFILIVLLIISVVSTVQEKRQQIRFGKSKDIDYSISKTEGIILVPLLLTLLVLINRLQLI